MQAATIDCHSTCRDYPSEVLQVNDNVLKFRVTCNRVYLPAIPQNELPGNSLIISLDIRYSDGMFEYLFGALFDAVAPLDEFQPSIRMFNDRSTAINPVSAIDVQDFTNVLDGSTMDVPANHAIQTAILY